jgi:hypothetical protein
MADPTIKAGMAIKVILAIGASMGIKVALTITADTAIKIATITVGTAVNTPIITAAAPSRIGIGTGEIGCPTNIVIETTLWMIGAGMAFISLRVGITGLASMETMSSRR